MNLNKGLFILIFGILLIIGCFAVTLYWGNSQKSKIIFIYQKYYIKKDLKYPSNYNGLWREWDENGNLLNISEIKNGLLNGEKNYYNPSNNRLLGREKYKNGKLNGKQEFYDKEGKLYRVCIWDEDNQSTQMIWYHKNGNELINCFFQNNAFNGEFNCFYENSNKKLKGFVLNNRPVDEWFYWENDKDEIKKKLNANNNEDLKLIKNLIIDSSPLSLFDLNQICN